MTRESPSGAKKRHAAERISDSALSNEKAGLLDIRTAAVITAHPDDETLWSGGTILMHPEIRWNVFTLCRKSDPDRAPRFAHALTRLGASGTIGDLNDGPEQSPLSSKETEDSILSLLPPTAEYDLVLTHSPFGEYTRHIRHEETGLAVSVLWSTGRLNAGRVWIFAYEDGNGSHTPKAIDPAHRKIVLPEEIFEEKYRIITEVYGFEPGSWEARTVPRVEAFFCFRTPREIAEWYDRGGKI